MHHSFIFTLIGGLIGVILGFFQTDVWKLVVHQYFSMRDDRSGIIKM